jgi:hypothetical protein
MARLTQAPLLCLPKDSTWKDLPLWLESLRKAEPNSNVDLRVVTQFDSSYFEQAPQIRMRLGRSLLTDLLVRMPEELQYQLEIGDQFMQEIVERGR